MGVNISVRSKRFNADITLNEKVTFICGDSGVGKTQFTKCMASSITGVSVSVSDGFDCTVLTKSRFEDYQSSAKRHGLTFSDYLSDVSNFPIHSCVIVVDDEDFVSSKEFAEFVNADRYNYYIIINRTKLSKIGYSVHEVYDFIAEGINHFLRKRVSLNNNDF